MTNEIDRKEIDDVLRIVDEILPLLDDAKSSFKSARNWGIVDMLGGGLITDLIKHSKINNAANSMSRINYLLGDLQRELKDVRIPSNYAVNTGTFATFADFVFDGILADVYMQSKIMSSLNEVETLENRILILREQMLKLRNN